MGFKTNALSLGHIEGFNVFKADLGGRGRTPPPEAEKYCFRQMVLFPKARCFVTDFPKIIKNSIFLLNFYQKLSKFSQNFPKLCVLFQTREKLTHGLLNFLKNMLK